MPGGSDKSNEGKLIVLFRSTGEVMKAESALKEARLPVMLRPVPKHISSDCGVCIEFDPGIYENVVRVLNKNKIYFARITSI